MKRMTLLMSLLFVCGEGFSQPYDPVADPGAVFVSGEARFSLLACFPVRMEWSPTSLLAAAQAGNRISLAHANAGKEPDRLRTALPRVKADITAMHIDPVVRSKVLRHLAGIGEQARRTGHGMDH